MEPANQPGPTPVHIPKSYSLQSIHEKFERLREVRNFVREHHGHDWLQGRKDGKTSEPPNEILDPIDDELFRLAWLAVNLPTNLPCGVQHKAAILAELVEDEPDDLVSTLTRSLLQDLAKCK